MLAAMTSIQLARWEAFYIAENAVIPEDEESAQMADMDMSEHAKAGLKKMLAKPRTR